MSFETKQVSLSIDKKVLLRDINLTLNTGELTAIVGPNGAGKSTLFKILTHEYPFFKGEVLFNGKPYQDWPLADLSLQIGQLPQSSALNFPFSAYDVVMLGRLPHSTGTKRDQVIVEQALTAVDATHLANATYPTLSGGEKQRVQLARVLAQIWESCAPEHQRFLLLDEPTSALDLSHQHLTLSLAKKLVAEDVGVVAILHDLNLAAQYADRIIMLKQGEVFADGTIAETLTAAHIQAVFDIPVNVITHPTSNRPLVINQ